MSNENIIERFVTEIQEIVQNETGIKPARSTVSDVFDGDDGSDSVPAKQVPIWIRNSIVGGSKVMQN